MNLEKIIKELNKAENDNKKFALLVILSQLIKTNKLVELESNDKDSHQELSERLFHAIGSHFIARLIVSSQVPENCSKSVFKSVAMSILTKFSQFRDIACDPIILSKIKHIINILKTSRTKIVELEASELVDSQIAEELDLERNLLENTFNYLFALSEYCSNHLCKNGLLNVLLDDYFLDDATDQNDHFIQISEQLIDKICKYDAKFLNNESKDEINAFLKTILQVIEKKHDKLKFKLIKLFENLTKMSSVSNRLSLLFKDDTKLVNETVLNIFNDLFKTKNLKSIVKDVVFSTFSWFIQNSENFLDEIYKINKQLFYLIAHLVSIEIRLFLEDNTKTLNDLALNRETGLDRLSVFYTIFEKFIIFIAISPLINEESDEQQIKFLLKLIMETMNTILAFIKDVLASKEYEKLDASSDDNVKLNGYLILVASIRVLTCWFAYEELIEYEIIDLYDDIVKFSEHYVTFYKNSVSFINIYQFLVPGLNRFIENNKDVVGEISSNTNASSENDCLIEKFDIVKRNLKICSEN